MSPAIRSLNYEPEELTTMNNEEVLSRVHPEDLPNLRKSLVSLNETGKTLAEYRFRGSNGAYTWWSNQMILIRDSEGQPIYRDGFVRDVTQQKEAEAALRESEERFRVMFAATPTTICALSMNVAPLLALLMMGMHGTP